MDELLGYFKAVYYTDPLVFSIALFGFIRLSLIKPRNRVVNLFRIYFAGYVITFLFSYANWATYKESGLLFTFFDNGTRQIDFFFMIYEFFLFAGYIWNFSKTRDYYIVSTGFLVASFAFYIASFTPSGGILNIFSYFSIQGIFLIILCLYYFIKIYNKEDQIRDSKERFLVISCLLIFGLSSLPYSFFGGYLSDNYRSLRVKLHTIIFVLYIMLFISIIKACLKKRTDGRSFLALKKRQFELDPVESQIG